MTSSLLNLAKKIKTFFKKFKEKVLPKEIPSFSKWRRIGKVLTKKEKIALGVFLILFLGSSFIFCSNFYLRHTQVKPAFGGIYTEGLIDQPRFINPIYGITSDTDRDLIQLIFSGLMKYSPDGKIVPDIAQSYRVLDEGKTFKIHLKENVFFSDGKKLTADDVVFTIQTIQNPDYKSPLRAQWLDVKVQKISDFDISLKLKSPYASFLETLTLKIIPKHIWEKISPQNFPLSIYNLNAVGSGPYLIKDLKRNKSEKIRLLTLTANPKYYGEKPKIKEISFRFFDTEEELIKAAQEKEIQGLSIINPGNYQLLLEDNFREYHLSLPRYFAVYFNPDFKQKKGEEYNESKVLADPAVRKALNYGTNKEEIIKKVLLNQAKVINSPILPEVYNFSPPSKIYLFDLEKAKELLDKAGFAERESGVREKIIKKESVFQFKEDLKLGSHGTEVRKLQECLAKDPEIYPSGDITGFFGKKTKEAVIKFQEKYSKEILEPWGFKRGTGLVAKTTRSKLNELCGKTPGESLKLSFTLATVDQPLLVKIANILKKQWQALGAKVEVKTFNIKDLEREVIKPRNYSALLFGEVLGAIPDPFPFWHSSQVKDPGLNLALYANKDADKLLEEVRETLDSHQRIEKLEKFQDILINDAPVVFLYQPDYIYLVSDEVKGITAKVIVDPSKRFSNIENWYIKTKRVWK